MADQIISTWGRSPLLSSRVDLERQFGPDPLETVAFAIADRTVELARDRNAYARRLLEDRLPRPLHFLLDRPHALRWLFRLAPRSRPTMTVVDTRQSVGGTTSAAAAQELARMWIAEMRAAGTAPDGGLVFTYTDRSGLPAEVYL